MDTRQRFLNTMRGQQADRAPLFNEGIREDVLLQWQRKGYLADQNLERMFTYDKREEISLELPTGIDLSSLVKKRNGLEIFRDYLNSKVESSMPSGWLKNIASWQKREHVLMLMVHWGFFQTLGVEDWDTFYDCIYLIADHPEFTIEAMNLYGQFAAQLTEYFLEKVRIDAVIFSEPIGGHHGSLISPKTYQEIGLASYYPILDVLKKYDVDILIWRTYANTRVLLPIVIDVGINCLWSCECNPTAMDYLEIRKEFGEEIGLIAGVDLDILHESNKTIKKELARILPTLLDRGRYAPLADGRVRSDIPFEKYVFYRNLLESYVMGK